MSKGIILIALGATQYGRMAASLAATIKVCDPGANITLVCSESTTKDLSQKEIDLFDNKTIIENPAYLLRPKLMLPELSPYDQTLYLDVDMAWLGGTVSDLLKGCEPYDFCIKNYGFQILNTQHDDPKAWAKNSDISLVYRLGEEKHYHLSSEIIYFKKTDAVLKMFGDALEVFDKPKIEFKTFAGHMGDELAFEIAMMQNKLSPGIDKWEPVWWQQSNKAKPTIQNLRESFYAISMGGVRSTSQVEAMYNNLVKSAYQQLGVSNPYKWINKIKFLTERKTW